MTINTTTSAGVAVIVMLYFQTTPVRAYNLVPNPSVEEIDPEHADRPLNWESSTEGEIEAIFTYKQNSDSGQRSLHVDVKSSNTGDAKWISAPFSIPSGGTTYIVSDTYRSNAATDLLVHAMADDGNDEWILVTTLTAANTWVSVTEEVYIPSGTTTVQVLHLISDAGWLETDDYSMQEKNATADLDSGTINGGTAGSFGSVLDASLIDDPSWEPTVYQHGELAGGQQPDSGSIRVPQTTSSCSVGTRDASRNSLEVWLFIIVAMTAFVRRLPLAWRPGQPLKQSRVGTPSIGFVERIRSRRFFCDASVYATIRQKRGFFYCAMLILFILYTSTGCDSTESVRYSQVQSIVSGDFHNCALLRGGSVRCWGQSIMGQLGYGNRENIGDDESCASAGDVEIGGKVVQLSAGKFHTCALLENNAVRCWGHGFFGQLGYGNTEDIGDDETPKQAGDVDIDATVVQLAAGGLHTCVLLDTEAVRCWGDGTNGQLGYANVEDIGDDESPAVLEDVDVGGKVKQIVAGDVHSCALLENGSVRCWGRGEPPLEDAVGGFGQLGYGNLENIGDDETPASAGDVDVGEKVRSLAAGSVHTCAVLESGAVRCWGRDEGRQGFGQLGYGTNENIGDNETPASAGDIDVGEAVTQIAAADVHTCALLENGRVRCWGFGGFGQLGYGNRYNVGIDKSPAEAGDIDVGGQVRQISAGARHTCALLENNRVICWGQGASGQLGTGHLENIGDDESPADSGPIRL